MSEDWDLFVPVEPVAPRLPNRDHTEDQRVIELEGEQTGVEQPRGEDSATVVM